MLNKKQARLILKDVEKQLSLEERQSYFNLRYYGYLDILTSIDFKPDMKILDIGFEPAHLEMALNKLGVDIYGVTFELWYPKSKERAKKYNIKYNILNVEKDKLPYKDSTFDVVILTEIMEHFYLDCYNALRESYRVLKKGGKIIITTPNAVSGHKRLTLLVGKLNRVHPRETFKRNIYHKHHFLYKLSELSDLARDVGFKIDKKSFIQLDEKIYMIGPNHREYKIKFFKILRGRSWNFFFRKLWQILGIIPSWRSHIKIIAKK
jgi:SAM-dependent methyltransferase